MSPILGIMASQNYPRIISIDYLVIAGGGGGYGIGEAGYSGGGGGAGGFRSTVTATGGGGSLESALTVAKNVEYPVVVGAGGATNAIGNISTFLISSQPGGRGGGHAVRTNGGDGGCGGGGSATAGDRKSVV